MEHLFLFHSTLGVVQMRKALQKANVPFRIADIPRRLRGGCGLALWLQGADADARRWVIPGLTQAIYRCDGDAFILLAEYPAAEQAPAAGAGHQQ
ncbi:DUF3343 domain-containing protein [[Enterobacter] lignolyticus]|uniref:Putative Se/S carrier protein-like domain-containing protein n=1 Tax=[Enterobacter] lignolyticus TaxID=1334193 RepID=A0A806X6W3_9ENTR|nr:hypothetical protein AO703_02870 [[Enterobacter] lignolyticus]